MADLDALLDALDKVRLQGGDSFVIVAVGPRDEHYAQFASDDAGGLYAEVVGNRYLPADAQLSPAQEAALQARGWVLEDTDNWGHTWPDASTLEVRQRAAYQALSTLDEVHGASGDLRIVDLHLAGDGTEGEAPVGVPNPAAARAAIVIAAFLLALGVALAVFFGA